VSDEKQLDRVMREAQGDMDDLTEVDPHPDRTRELRTPGFSRMRLEWSGPDAQVLTTVMGAVQGALMRIFPMAYEVMHQIFLDVREPEVHPSTGEIMQDQYGFPMWKKKLTGTYIEDWSALTDRRREHFLHQISAHLFEWEQASQDLWGEAMFAKAAWEERFAWGYTTSEGKTIGDRTQRARQASQEERYFAIYRTLLSRKADALVRSMQLINQRLKDTTLR
jgi:hypothetical protein